MPPKILKHLSHIFKGQIQLEIDHITQTIDCSNSCCCKYFYQCIQTHMCLIALFVKADWPVGVREELNPCYPKYCPWTSPWHHLTGLITEQQHPNSIVTRLAVSPMHI